MVALLTRMSARLTEVGTETVYGIFGDYFAGAELFSRVQDQVLHIGAGVMATILKHAEERGEVRHGISPPGLTVLRQAPKSTRTRWQLTQMTMLGSRAALRAQPTHDSMDLGLR